jgi:hypothetical protein
VPYLESGQKRPVDREINMIRARWLKLKIPPTFSQGAPAS